VTSFLLALMFAPVVMALLWMYTSPLARLDGYTAAKVLIRIILFFLTMGALIASVAFVTTSGPIKNTRPYALALLIIEAIPMLAIMLYRHSQNPSAYGSWNSNSKR